MNYREQAIENLMDRLLSHRTVDLVSSREIFHDLTDEISSHQYQTLLDILDGVLSLNYKAGDEHLLACRELEGKAKDLIHGYVLRREDWLFEEEQRIRADQVETEEVW